MSQSYEGKVVLVTGAGRGMGRAIADAFADEGARLVISARTARYGEEAVAAIRERGGEAVLACGDMGDRQAITEMIDTAISNFGQLDVLVHCAADNAHAHVVDMTDEAFDYLVRSNIQSLFWIAKDAAPHLGKSADKGRLIYISSGSANRNYLPGLIPYASSKAFMNAFARGLALEFGPLNVLVNVIEPGMVASARMKDELSDAQADAIAANFPIPRPGRSEEIAAAVLFMASPQASYITGSALLVDGGASMAQLGGLNSLNK
ncbi:SDR family oxidoreductase [Stutzerimonas xanthomarina]|jgi:3-oxoacyl-[acyl-carrier protein] reductase|uniref:SDR family oxidoreductase n=1 Tax=Stutzerimonas xanthomarina TaxID=271420 RepID=A0A3R9AXL0_9GAMM|nr:MULTISPECIES: SDR family oxidoreductase [Stutzerimonas]MCW8158365.1 SDR family oxidoreductase [Stutzerimonas stutzeri]RRV13477.1 SDR family oxidoreductase [Stutzerimonas xanthomarina]